MATIQLTQGRIAIVDEDGYHRLNSVDYGAAI
jgi:hypothetical protein